MTAKQTNLNFVRSLKTMPVVPKLCISIMFMHAQLQPTFVAIIFGGQEYLSELQFPSPHDLFQPRDETPMSSMSTTLLVDSSAAEPSGEAYERKADLSLYTPVSHPEA